ncbi:MAG: P27 family phage terminase small subunit [Planctomycetota bacterium]|jgi:phage terminase small subunit
MAKKRATKKATRKRSGSRGPLKGKGGRPTAAKRKKATTRKKAARKKTTRKAEANQFVEELAELSFEQLKELAGRWQTLSTQDCVLLSVLWEQIRRYRVLVEEVHRLDPSEWTFTTEKGYRGPIPELAMLTTASNQIVKLAARFGMSPADRARLGDELEGETGSGSPFGQHMQKVTQLSGEVEDAQAARKRR